MLGIDAPRIVAMVADVQARGYLAIVQQIRKTVSPDILALDLKLAVPFVRAGASPLPTARSRVNLNLSVKPLHKGDPTPLCVLTQEGSLSGAWVGAVIGTGTTAALLDDRGTPGTRGPLSCYGLQPGPPTPYVVARALLPSIPSGVS